MVKQYSSKVSSEFMLDCISGDCTIQRVWKAACRTEEGGQGQRAVLVPGGMPSLQICTSVLSFWVVHFEINMMFHSAWQNSIHNTRCVCCVLLSLPLLNYICPSLIPLALVPIKSPIFSLSIWLKSVASHYVCGISGKIFSLILPWLRIDQHITQGTCTWCEVSWWNLVFHTLCNNVALLIIVS